MEKTKAEHELILLDRTNSAQKASGYLALNPLGRIPTLVDGDVVIFESAAICLYLADKHTEVRLIPDVSSPKRASVYQWLMYLTNTLQAELKLYSYPQRYVDQGDSRVAFLSSVEQRLIEMLGLIYSQLKRNDYLASDELSICDYFLFMLCVWADQLERPPLEFEHLSKYLKKMTSLDEVHKVCRHENLSLRDYC